MLGSIGEKNIGLANGWRPVTRETRKTNTHMSMPERSNEASMRGSMKGSMRVGARVHTHTLIRAHSHSHYEREHSAEGKEGEEGIFKSTTRSRSR